MKHVISTPNPFFHSQDLPCSSSGFHCLWVQFLVIQIYYSLSQLKTTRESSLVLLHFFSSFLVWGHGTLSRLPPTPLIAKRQEWPSALWEVRLVRLHRQAPSWETAPSSSLGNPEPLRTLLKQGAPQTKESEVGYPGIFQALLVFRDRVHAYKVADTRLVGSC